jgi:hypothetical protein
MDGWADVGPLCLRGFADDEGIAEREGTRASEEDWRTDGVGGLNLQRDGLSRQGLDEDLHVGGAAQSRLRLTMRSRAEFVGIRSGCTDVLAYLCVTCEN